MTTMFKSWCCFQWNASLGCSAFAEAWVHGGGPFQEEAGHEMDVMVVAEEPELGIQTSPPPYDVSCFWLNHLLWSILSLSFALP